jgi:Holliday junction resolvasome RuvABC endonuclease subunit
MRFLALDLATSTGWATNYPAVESGTQVFDVKRGESPGMRYLRFRAWLESMISACQPEVLVYEQTHQRGGAATEIAAGLATRVQEMAAQHGLQHVALHSSSLKKHATGSGRAGKPEMMAAASTFYPGQVIRTDDQGDALCLLHWAIEEYEGAA